MRSVTRILYSLYAIVSCGSPQANRAQKGVEVGDDALVESIECVALLLGERGIGRNWPQQPGGQRGVDALEQFQEDDANPVALRSESIPSRVFHSVNEPLGSKLRQIVTQGAESILVGGRVERGRGGRMEIPGGERIAAGNVRESDESMH